MHYKTVPFYLQRRQTTKRLINYLPCDRAPIKVMRILDCSRKAKNCKITISESCNPFRDSAYHIYVSHLLKVLTCVYFTGILSFQVEMLPLASERKTVILHLIFGSNWFANNSPFLCCLSDILSSTLQFEILMCLSLNQVNVC